MIANKDYALIKAIKNHCKCNKKDAGLTGNLVDDWVTVVTHDEYTKYDDIHMTVEGGASENPGWRRSPKSLTSNQSRGIAILAIYPAIPVVIILDWIFKPNGPAVEYPIFYSSPQSSKLK